MTKAGFFAHIVSLMRRRITRQAKAKRNEKDENNERKRKGFVTKRSWQKKLLPTVPMFV
jgi:hypothetical protein